MVEPQPSQNGSQGEATELQWPDDEATLILHENATAELRSHRQAADTAELAAINAGYAAEARRYGALERTLWHWKCFTFFVLAVCGSQLVLIAYLAWKQSYIHTYVQVVQVNGEGKVQMLGIPQDLLDFSVEDTMWLDMLSQWVRYWRWIGTDTEMAQAQWQWLYAHACGMATRQLKAWEEDMQPFTPTDREVIVNITARSKMAAPNPASYQVAWTESSKKKYEPAVVTHYTGTFTVSRKRPEKDWEARHNLGGLCVQALSYDVQLVGK